MAISKNNIGYRPTWAEVNLDNVAYNFRQIKKLVSPGVKVMVTVKADAYGHGLIPVAKRLCACGVDYLGVASIDEGVKLREANIDVPVLVLGLVLQEDVEPLCTYNLTATVCTKELALELSKTAKRFKKPIRVHIKVDTGMGRIGVMHQDAFEIVKYIHRLKFIHIEGIFTHLAFADMNKEFTLHQIELFNNLLEKLRVQGIHIPFTHAANSAGLINCKKGHFNMVRPGLITYGLYPAKGLGITLRPVLSLRTKVVYVKKVPGGYGISYGHIYVTKAATTIATLPIGYGDGYPRNLSNLASVLVKGKRFKISGRVCMDQIMVDVGHLPVKAGDEVALIGSQGKNKITVEELADLSGTIPYEIVCGLGSRIPRVYTGTEHRRK
jgi:alanine racemase